jgi:sortase B
MNKFSRARSLMVIVCIVTAVISLIKLVHSSYEYKVGRDTYSSLREISISNAPPQNSSEESSSSIDNYIIPIVKTPEEVLINEQELRKINTDYRLWMKINNTNINYPVVQGKDNSYYLDHDFQHIKGKVGTVFIDYRNDIEKSRNIVIYGHNMNDGSMFHDLVKYKDEDFFKANSEIIITLDNRKYKYKIFSVYVTKSTDNYFKLVFNSDKEFENYLNDAMNKSSINSDIKAGSGDKIITLSTCSYEFDDARTVIHAKLI